MRKQKPFGKAYGNRPIIKVAPKSRSSTSRSTHASSDTLLLSARKTTPRRQNETHRHVALKDITNLPSSSHNEEHQNRSRLTYRGPAKKSKVSLSRGNCKGNDFNPIDDSRRDEEPALVPPWKDHYFDSTTPRVNNRNKGLQRGNILQDCITNDRPTIKGKSMIKNSHSHSTTINDSAASILNEITNEQNRMYLSSQVLKDFENTPNNTGKSKTAILSRKLINSSKECEMDCTSDQDPLDTSSNASEEQDNHPMLDQSGASDCLNQDERLNRQPCKDGNMSKINPLSKHATTNEKSTFPTGLSCQNILPSPGRPRITRGAMERALHSQEDDGPVLKAMLQSGSGIDKRKRMRDENDIRSSSAWVSSSSTIVGTFVGGNTLKRSRSLDASEVTMLTHLEDVHRKEQDHIERGIARHPDLPPGWVIRISRSKRRPYYVHPDFGSTWHCPVVYHEPKKVEHDNRNFETYRAEKEPNPKESNVGGTGENLNCTHTAPLCTSVEAEQKMSLVHLPSPKRLSLDCVLPVETALSSRYHVASMKNDDSPVYDDQSTVAEAATSPIDISDQALQHVEAPQVDSPSLVGLEEVTEMAVACHRNGTRFENPPIQKQPTIDSHDKDIPCRESPQAGQESDDKNIHLTNEIDAKFMHENSCEDSVENTDFEHEVNENSEVYIDNDDNFSNDQHTTYDDYNGEIDANSCSNEGSELDEDYPETMNSPQLSISAESYVPKPPNENSISTSESIKSCKRNSAYQHVCTDSISTYSATRSVSERVTHPMAPLCALQNLDEIAPKRVSKSRISKTRPRRAKMGRQGTRKKSGKTIIRVC